MYTQWYYFSVHNVMKGNYFVYYKTYFIGGTYKFNIINLYKDDSAYSVGMKPFVYSLLKNQKSNTNMWNRGCTEVDYFKNTVRTK